MYFFRKLRPPEMSIEAIIGLSLAPVLLLLFILSGLKAMFGFIAIIELIAIPYVEDDNVVYSLTSNYWKKIGLKSGYGNESWVSIDSSGNVNVFISKSDYLKFKADFSFDQLCNSMGNLFIEFFEMFKRGEGVRIIQRFNDLRLNPFIE